MSDPRPDCPLCRGEGWYPGPVSQLAHDPNDPDGPPIPYQDEEPVQCMCTTGPPFDEGQEDKG